MAKKTYNGVTYDDSVDYSAAIEAAKSKGQDTSSLVAARNAKIADKYGGNEPTMYGSNQTYNQLSGSNANSQNQSVVRNAVNTANTSTNNAVKQQAASAAQSGNWDLVGSLVNQLATPDGYYGGTNMEFANQYMKDLQNQYQYNANSYYGGLYDQAYGAGAWDGGTGTGQPVYNDFSQALYQAAYQAANGQNGAAGGATANPYAGTNYHADAIKYAQAGDWDSVLAALKQRDEKTMNTGENYGRNSSDILASLLAQYGVKTQDYNGFEYEAAPEYYDDYQVKIDAALDRLLNRDAFSYNPEEDEAYQAYRDMYTREGDRAMRDTLGQMAARTGGMASSYAATAAQQANQYYMQQLADKVPELQQLAYQMYLDDINLQAQDLGLLQNASSEAYNRFRDTMADWQNDREFAYGNYRDGIADQRYDTEWQYQLDRDALADTRYDTEWEYQLSRDELADQRYDSEWNYQKQQDAAAAARQAAELEWEKEQYEREWADYIASKNADTEEVGTVDDTEGTDDLAANALPLGLAAPNARLITQIATAGGITEDANGKLHWANGWSASNYKEKLTQAKYYNPVLNMLQ